MYNYKYEQFIQDITKSRDLLQSYKPSSIVGVARGGLTFAHFLAEALDIRKVFAINSVSYSEKERLKNIEIFGVPELRDEQDILIVDDIADSGRTLKEIIKILQNRYPDSNFKTFTLFYKESSIFKPDYYLYTTEEWIKFFWES